jgi:formate dehydrogenase
MVVCLRGIWSLASEMKMAMAEVYVATFYHHFDVVKEGNFRRPPPRARCDSIIAIWQGHDFFQHCRAFWARTRVCAPCVGR